MKGIAIRVGCGFYLAAALFAAPVPAQTGEQTPHIGYLYPAGGRQGTTVEVSVGGQYLRGAKTVYFSGEGVRATVTSYVRPLNNDLLKAIGQRLREVRKAQSPDAPGARAPVKVGKKAPDADAATVPLPDHPLLRNLDALSPAELQYVADYFFSKKRQKNAQIGELAVLEITIDPGADPGERELRLGAAGGLTNPMCFEVGQLPETSEREPNDPPAAAKPPAGALPETPFLLNGQILPGDVDRFWFHGRAGQNLVVEATARGLNPYLADAVPGWFQATLSLYDAAGRELASNDDYRFNPDPVLCFKVPADGDYAVEIGDALYRGREDFVYRVAVGEQPFITAYFPLGGHAGEALKTEIAGWNLPARTLALDTESGGGDTRQTCMEGGQTRSNTVTYAVDDSPESLEAEPNDTIETARRVPSPGIVNGRIDRPGDTDLFQFDGHAGDGIVAEVIARRLQSPVDSVLYLLDASGATLAWNDDRETPNTGLLTHHADSYLRAQLPEDGVFYVKVADAQHNGGSACAYRLRIGPPRPDFELYVTPSTLNIHAGLGAPATVHAVRKDGFDGEIVLALADVDNGFTLEGGRIPAGCDGIRVTFGAPRQAPPEPVTLQLAGRAEVGGRPVCRTVAPAEDMMQAFLYRHLVPSRQLLAAVRSGRRPAPAIKVVPAGAIRIPAGGTAEVRVQAPPGPMLEHIQLTLNDPPDGITLAEVKPATDGLALVLSADGELVAPGFTDNLIVAASTEAQAPRNKAAGARTNRRVALGVLPAIPIEVVAP